MKWRRRASKSGSESDVDMMTRESENMEHFDRGRKVEWNGLFHCHATSGTQCSHSHQITGCQSGVCVTSLALA